MFSQVRAGTAVPNLAKTAIHRLGFFLGISPDYSHASSSSLRAAVVWWTTALSKVDQAMVCTSTLLALTVLVGLSEPPNFVDC